MVAIGSLMNSLNLSVIMSVVEDETTVSRYLLIEDADFVKVASYANTMAEVLDWVNENY
jgi:hypothetical protein|tara:strand:+ start:2716 stop:2892 length:177 start_codon:yes stop_codon:yes gene_type:complete